MDLTPSLFIEVRRFYKLFALFIREVEMRIRKARKSDTKKISMLKRNTQKTINSKDYRKEVIDHLVNYNSPRKIEEKIINSDVFCAWNDGKLIGTVTLEKDLVGGLYIKPSFIGKGVGRKLMDFIENFAKKKGIKKVKLYPTKTAIKFYEKLGYKKVKSSYWKIDKLKVRFYEMEKSLKNDIRTDIVKNKNLTKNQKKTINDARKKEFGKEEVKNFSKDYEPETLWFFVKNKNKIVSLGGLRPVKLEFKGKNYDIWGICSTISLEKKKDYGKIMICSMIHYAKENDKTILGFTSDKNLKIFEKIGLKTKKDFIKRFVYVKPNGKKIYDNDGSGIYYERKDKIISKILKNKEEVKIFVEHW